MSREVAGTIPGVPTPAHPRRGPRGRSPQLDSPKLDDGVRCVLLVDLLLMGITVTALALPQPALALVTGTGCVSLSRLLARSLL